MVFAGFVFFVGLVVFAGFVVFVGLVVFAGFVVFGRACGFLSCLWVLGVLVVFGRACGSPFRVRGKGQTAKEFDATVEVVLVT